MMSAFAPTKKGGGRLQVAKQTRTPWRRALSAFAVTWAVIANCMPPAFFPDHHNPRLRPPTFIWTPDAAPPIRRQSANSCSQIDIRAPFTDQVDATNGTWCPTAYYFENRSS
jgi:hypothetical protein